MDAQNSSAYKLPEMVTTATMAMAQGDIKGHAMMTHESSAPRRHRATEKQITAARYDASCCLYINITVFGLYSESSNIRAGPTDSDA